MKNDDEKYYRQAYYLVDKGLIGKDQVEEVVEKLRSINSNEKGSRESANSTAPKPNN